MNTFGRHLLVEYFGCNRQRLDDKRFIEDLMSQAAYAANATPLQHIFHRFSPHGVTGLIVIAESHLSIHTWPEEGYASMDFYTCGTCTPEPAKNVIADGLQASHWEILEVHRGLMNDGKPASPSIRPEPRRIEYATWNSESKGSTKSSTTNDSIDALHGRKDDATRTHVTTERSQR